MTNSLWRDYYVDFGDVDSSRYSIELSDTSEVIYSGVAYRRPGEASLKVRINDICADYIANVLPQLGMAEFTQLSLPLSFDVRDSEDEILDTVQFINDWSYDKDFNPDTMGLTHPINGRVDKNGVILWTGLNVSEVSVDFTTIDGLSYSITMPVEISGDFSIDYNEDFSRGARSAGSGTLALDLSQYPDVDTISIEGITWKVARSCNRYTLLYVNAYGGWDTFLIEGNDKETDQITRFSREVEYDNNFASNRGKDNYLNEVSKGWQLTTGWLADDESKRMHHLVESTDVYLYDMVGAQLIPVTIKTSNLDYKTYTNNGRRFVNYTISVDEAKTRIRR